MNPVLFIIGIPATAGIFLAFIPYYRFAAQANVVASALTFAASLTLFAYRPETTAFILVDDFNIYLIALTAFVAFTTSLFSARYIIHEVEIGRLQSGHLRFYHAMYQGFIFTMLMVLTTNNLGVMWVSLEGATLTTVLMVGLYRTAEALEAAWKYFILCGVGIALALFGTTLMYLAAQPVMGEGLPAMTWAAMLPRVSEFSPAILNLAFVFPVGWIWHESRSGTPSCVAARRPCRGPDPDFGGALRTVVERRALYRAALQDPAHGQRGRIGARSADGDDGTELAAAGQHHALPPARH